MAVLFWKPLNAILAVIPTCAPQRPHVNVSSIGGRIDARALAPYCVSNFSLTGLWDTTRSEARHLSPPSTVGAQRARLAE